MSDEIERVERQRLRIERGNPAYWAPVLYWAPFSWGMNNDDLFSPDDPNIIEGEVIRSYSPPLLPEQKLLPAPKEDKL